MKGNEHVINTSLSHRGVKILARFFLIMEVLRHGACSINGNGRNITERPVPSAMFSFRWISSEIIMQVT